MGEFIQKIRLFLGRRLLFALRGHFTRIERIQNLLPALRSLGIAQRKRKIVDPELPLLFFRPMTILTMGLEHRLMATIKHRLRRSYRYGGQRKEAGDEEKEGSVTHLGEKCSSGRPGSPARGDKLFHPIFKK